jgi:hypothetical protein
VLAVAIAALAPAESCSQPAQPDADTNRKQIDRKCFTANSNWPTYVTPSITNTREFPEREKADG